MKTAALPHARSLRAIGQALEALGISFFKVEKTARNKYLVHDWEPSFLGRKIEKFTQRPGSNLMLLVPGGRGSSLVYTAARTEKLASRARLKRGSSKIANPYKLSSALRVIGDFLDRKGAANFHISWSAERVSVRYESSLRTFVEEHFTMKNLHDLDAGMYLRRSERRAAR